MDAMKRINSKHLEMIEEVISRMSSNSFKLKGWTMTLVAAIVALGVGDSDKHFILFALLPIVCFCGLDCYYLRLERKYRHLYDLVRINSPEIEPFSMDLKNLPNDERTSMWECFKSPSVVVFYAVIIVAVLILYASIPACRCGGNAI